MASTMLQAPAAVSGPQPAAGYRPANFADAVLSESTKIRTLRSTFFTLAATVVFVVGLRASSLTKARSTTQPRTGCGTRPPLACRAW